MSRAARDNMIARSDARKSGHRQGLNQNPRGNPRGFFFVQTFCFPPRFAPRQWTSSPLIASDQLRNMPCSSRGAGYLRSTQRPFPRFSSGLKGKFKICPPHCRTMRAIKIWKGGALAVCTALAGCATYSPLPLDNPRTQRQIADITVSAASMPVQVLREHRFDPSDGLDVTEVAMLAVANNPDLRSQRDGERIARTQAFAAGLLPDPQLSYEHDH